MDFVLAGYFPKDVELRPDWLADPRVEQICSVSKCISKGPKGWIDLWLHNDLGWYDSPEIARRAIPKDGRGFQVLAYWILPVVVQRATRKPLQLPELSVSPMPATFELLGFDVVSKSASDFFECSPLSCCNLASEFPVNRYCLLETRDAAEAAAEQFAREEPEPGPYYIFQVWRDAAGP